MTNAAITGWGEGHAPAVLTNDDLSTFLETSDEWITSRTGMKERRVSHVSAIEMATLASHRALACADLDPAALELIVYGSVHQRRTGPQLGLGCPARPRRHPRRRDGRQHGVHQLPVRALQRHRDDSERDGPERAW
ncbi:MAG: hypothetical protein U5L03_08280 [Burkholderiaceae bacterium]|nr:hypothetical protein [Burkholderiaceae bacterium]